MADLAKLYSIEKIFGEVSHQPTAVSGLGLSRIYVFCIPYSVLQVPECGIRIAREAIQPKNINAEVVLHTSQTY